MTRPLSCKGYERKIASDFSLLIFPTEINTTLVVLRVWKRRTNTGVLPIQGCSTSVSMTTKELEQIEERARRGLPIDPKLILILTAYLRDVLQAKLNAEAVAREALKKAGLSSRYYTADMRGRR